PKHGKLESHYPRHGARGAALPRRRRDDRQGLDQPARGAREARCAGGGALPRSAGRKDDLPMNLPTLAEIEAAAQTVYRTMPPTPQYRWPLVCEHAGTEVWLKHENHTPVGAFKLRGGLVYFSQLQNQPRVIAATRGNHGQSVALCARQYGMEATIVVPHGNSVEKNAAMRSLGAVLVEHGEDFQAARLHAESLAKEKGLFMVPSFHRVLMTGVASASLELFRAVPGIDTLYVPIGLGSGICAAVAARNALGLSTDI